MLHCQPDGSILRRMGENKRADIMRLAAMNAIKASGAANEAIQGFKQAEELYLAAAQSAMKASKQARACADILSKASDDSRPWIHHVVQEFLGESN